MAEGRGHEETKRQIFECLYSAYLQLCDAVTEVEEALLLASKIDSANVDQLSLAHRAVEDAWGCVKEVLQLYE